MVAALAADRKAFDIAILDISALSSIADYFVICTGRSHIQVDAICSRVAEGMREDHGVRLLSAEGLENGHWGLLDFGDVVLHVFQDEFRRLYDLERLWSQASRWHYEEGSANETASV